MSNEEEVIRNDSVEAPDRDSLLRAMRNLEASQARVKANAEHVYDEKRRDLVLELLPVLDNLDRILDAAVTASDKTLVDALRMLSVELEGVLVRYGVERVEAAGEVFDPSIHDAISAVQVVDPRLVGTVVHQISAGYRFGGKVLRVARVSVGVAAQRGHAARTHSRPAI
jgi:molecular chaperone GrpE